MKQLVIEAANVSKEFVRKGRKKTIALTQFSMAAEAGSLTALIGPDGAGKTTFLRMVCGLLSPTAGSLQVLGIDVAKEPQRVQELLGYMPQKFGLYEDLTCQENLNLYADLHGLPREKRQERFARLLNMTGLSPFTGRLAGKLSGGMKQKLGLACTLVRSPKLLLLDEPTVGVDPLSRRELWAILKQLVEEENISVLVSTAYMDEAELCGQVYVLNEGRLLSRGTPEQLRRIAVLPCRRPQVYRPGFCRLAFWMTRPVYWTRCRKAARFVSVCAMLTSCRSWMPMLIFPDCA